MTRRLIDCVKYSNLSIPQHVAFWELVESKLPDGWLANDGEGGSLWTSAPAPKQPLNLDAGLKLLREFEGCHLKAYKCPAGIWTIGWGSTRHFDGSPVREGDTITQAVADEMLESTIEFEVLPALRKIPHWDAMSPGQQGALASFAWNLGWHFYGAEGFETISRRLREKEWAKVPEALLLYVNPGSRFEAGLRRRREAEGRLWRGVAAPQLQQDFVLLSVPYEAQNDNASGTGYRECFSSSAAMVARFYGKVANDDAYNKIRAKFGDTTDSMAQVKALNSLGLTAQFRTNGTLALLEQELAAGRPVMVGWLHHGPASRPTGGGHWSVVIGANKDTIIHNDPNGEADITVGGYVNHTKGAGIAYSRKNWLPRWLPDGPQSGWCITVRG